jgi:hypothetical protein
VALTQLRPLGVGEILDGLEAEDFLTLLGAAKTARGAATR